MAVEAVIFDWGGTLTPWHTVDIRLAWRAVAEVLDPHRVEEVADRLLAAESALWERARIEHVAATLDDVFAMAELTVAEDALARQATAPLFAFWEPHTHTDPDVVPLFSRLRLDGVKVGVLSNTLWPRAWHEDFFKRDGVLDLIDGAVYTSEIPWTKPSPEAFRAAVEAVEEEDPRACVFVGDRLFDDIWGASQLGMRTILVPHSDIPVEQLGHTAGRPDEVVQRLSHVHDVVSAWRAAG
jgi:putative hydrolase of the HAD superfamily